MAFTQPYFSHHDENTEVLDRAGEALIGLASLADDFGDMRDVLDVVNNWRAAHQYPLNTFLQTLRNRAKEIDRTVDITSRLKRMPAREAKLLDAQRADRHDITLSNMQDIGGCRAVFQDVRHVYELADKYRAKVSLHDREREQDYIALPRRTGYRGYHLIYQHRSRRWPIYDGLRIEIQIRSQTEHIWATAVETADAGLGGRLKAGRGEPRWQRFFVLMSSAMAQREGCPRVPDAPRAQAALAQELRSLVTDLDVMNRVRYFGRSVQVLGNLNVTSSTYVVLILNAREDRMYYSTFPAHEAEKASAFYSAREAAKQPGDDVVLVRASDAAAVRRGYPSFFRDTGAFLDFVQEAVAS